jgi:predicted lipid-binding transport protein (Tim44 family)
MLIFMTKFSGLFFTLAIALTLSFSGISDAEAKRFGSARSFGSKSAYSKSYSRKASSTKRAASQKMATQQNQTARQSMSRRGGLMGMLGGLALGGLLGSLFFGGAFENFNFMDILIFGGIAYLLFKLFSARSGKQSSRPVFTQPKNKSRRKQTDPLSTRSYQRSESTPPNDAGFNTDIFSHKNSTSTLKATPAINEPKMTEKTVILPKDFNEEDFLDGAKGAYKMLQAAWDSKDISKIRGLTTDKVFSEIQMQIHAATEENKTNILNLEAELLEIRELNTELEATVLFDSLLHEDTNEDAVQVREVWTFIKPKSSLQPKWYLDGLQQLED